MINRVTVPKMSVEKLRKEIERRHVWIANEQNAIAQFGIEERQLPNMIPNLRRDLDMLYAELDRKTDDHDRRFDDMYSEANGDIGDYDLDAL